MEPQADLTGEISQLSFIGAELRNQLYVLEQGRDTLDRRFKSDLAALNMAIYELPPVINLLLLETPPPVSRTLLGSLQLVFRSLWSGSWQLQTLKSVQAAINTISTVQGSMQASQDEGSAKKIETADLAAKAAQHIAECSTLQARVSNAQRLTQASLDSTKRQISCAQEQIDECSRFSADMASKAAHHEKEAEGNKTLFWATCWIPVVNFVTIPLAMSWEKENNRLAESYRETLTQLTADLVKKSIEMRELERTSHRLDETFARLKSAGDVAGNTAAQCSQLTNRARVLTDKYGHVTARIRDVLQALGHLNGGDVSTERWDELRFIALQSLKGMIESLKERELLGPECLPVLEMVANLPLPSFQEGGMDLDGFLEGGLVV
ncbi:hypothetical protein QBC42DRAFT_266253 [Cladorrhinum samala]|uniref:Fungal N-terminal domain-containing protein n=1 Tax=Cladorrhinum samala TaxID=585594 RepID=A0AAV9HSD4_9PEZI|nr:hypothetical protein QBC42DRAFT_266253 [Cladorrhinum samala]